jgi:hypothetical protein
MWGPPHATIADARREGKSRLDAGTALQTFIVRIDPDGSKHLLLGGTQPKSALSAIRHWQELLEALLPNKE